MLFLKLLSLNEFCEGAQPWIASLASFQELLQWERTDQHGTKFSNVSFAHNQKVKLLAMPGKPLGFLQQKKKQQLQQCSASIDDSKQTFFFLSSPIFQLEDVFFYFPSSYLVYPLFPIVPQKANWAKCNCWQHFAPHVLACFSFLFAS